MNNTTKSYKIGNLDLKNTENYHLSIELSTSSIFFSLLQTQKLEYHFFKSIYSSSQNTKDLISIINSEDLLKEKYSTSSISYHNYPSTIIPDSFYNKKEKHKYLQLIDNNIEVVESDTIHDIHSTIVYSIPKRINRLINQIQPRIIQKNRASIIIQQLIRQYGNIKNQNIFLFVERNSIELVLLNHNKLLFHNIFTYNSNTDILYYILFTYDQLKLKTTENNLYIFGEISKGGELYSLLYEYIANISFGELSSSLSFSNKLQKINKHQYFALFSQLLCV